MFGVDNKIEKMATQNSVKIQPSSAKNQTKRCPQRLRVGDPDFEAPDGGWGWIICFACGFSNLCLFSPTQQFGLLFRDKFEDLGITAVQTSTIINVYSSLTSFMGLMNGPLFRTFTYRKVSLFGSAICFVSMVLLTFVDTFAEYIIVFSIAYGIGVGFILPANSLALNTYFDKKRRIATGFSWTLTALGPVIMPQIISFLLSEYGVQGSVLLFGGIVGHAIVCACLLHPVYWHTKFRDQVHQENPKYTTTLDEEIRSIQMHKSASFHKHDRYEIIDPDTPMLSNGNNNGLLTAKRSSVHSSKQSLAASISSKGSNTNSFEMGSKLSIPPNPKIDSSEPLILRQNHTTDNSEGLNVASDEKIEELLTNRENRENENLLMEKNGHSNNPKVIFAAENNEKKPQSCWQSIVIFFDLDLLKDLIYVNIMLGVTLVHFVEINFSILTPFILKDYNFSKLQTANYMSVVATVDIVVRFLIPFASAKVNWDNRTFFLVGAMCIAMGRMFLIATKSYTVSLPIAALIGFGRGLRTIFIVLVIPSHVTLSRLPAATGLQLLAGGIISLIFGPFIGWIRDKTEDYTFTLHFLNILTFLTVASWTIEKLIRHYKKKDNELKRDAGQL